MRVSWLVGSAVLVVSSLTIASPRVVVMTGDPASDAALRISVAGRGAELVSQPPPAEELRLDRAAAAQHLVRDASADAGVWIEPDPAGSEVFVVSADGKVVRHAPLPIDATPRMFAAIATSLLDELLAGGDAPQINVDVRVDVHAEGGPVVATTEEPDPLVRAPGLVPALPGITAGIEPVVRSNKTLFEIGPMLSPLSIGVEGQVMFPVAEQVRFGVVAGAGIVFTSASTPVVFAGGELRHVGRGAKHWDLGLMGGGASVQSDGVGIVALRISRTWETPNGSVGLVLSPAVIVTGDHGDPLVPALWATLRWGFTV